MKRELFLLALVATGCSIFAMEQWQKQTNITRFIPQSIKNLQIPSRQQMSEWVCRMKNNAIDYLKASFPKSKKDWVLTILGEGIAEGILVYKGLKALVEYHKDDANTFIDQSQKTVTGLMTGSLEETDLDSVDNEIKQTVNELIKQTKQKNVKAHYSRGVRGAFAYGKSHIFLQDDYKKDESLGAKNEDEFAFLAAHELGHLKQKDFLKLGAFFLAAPFISLAATRMLDATTSIIIDQLIKAMKLPEDSRAFRILTQIKSGKRRILRNPIIRFIVAVRIMTAYQRHIEKQADLFAAKQGYAQGGQQFFERIDKTLTPMQKSMDSIHPKPGQRVQYLKKYLSENE